MCVYIYTYTVHVCVCVQRDLKVIMSLVQTRTVQLLTAFKRGLKMGYPVFVA